MRKSTVKLRNTNGGEGSDHAGSFRAGSRIVALRFPSAMCAPVSYCCKALD
jgi:hypothetical protein